MRGTVEWIKLARRGGSVKRCHTMRTLREQNNAAHSFGVGILVMSFCESDPELFDHKLLSAALLHDLNEYQFGDAPAPTKWIDSDLTTRLKEMERQYDLDNHMFVQLTDRQKEVLVWADKMEYMFHCLEEMELGNRDESVVNGLRRSIGYLMNRVPPTPIAEIIFNDLQEEFNAFYK